MDPDCAICSQPAIAQCSCEAKGLDIAVRQAEQRMMTGVFSEIRSWVRGHAQDYILEYFNMLTTRRKESHNVHLRRLSEHAAYYYNARPHPSEIHAADAELKRGIDEDWRASVQRYPEVLEYFYGLVELGLPGEEDQGVKDPPLSALGGGKRGVRVRGEEGGGVAAGLGPGGRAAGGPGPGPGLGAREERERERTRVGFERDRDLQRVGFERDRDLQRERERARREGTRSVGPLPSQPPPPIPGTTVNGDRLVGGGGGKRASFAVPGYTYVPPGAY